MFVAKAWTSSLEMHFQTAYSRGEEIRPLLEHVLATALRKFLGDVKSGMISEIGSKKYREYQYKGAYTRWKRSRRQHSVWKLTFRKKHGSLDDDDKSNVTKYCRWLSIPGISSPTISSLTYVMKVSVRDKQGKLVEKYFWRGGFDELVKTHAKQSNRDRLVKSNARRT